MFPSQLFEHCPRCGRRRDPSAPRQPFHCNGCNLHFYFNAALAVAAILLGPDERLLFIRRAKEPAKGQLAVPGGFVDLEETAEAALRREIKEEVNLEVGPLQFLCSATNEYHYRGVTYPVLDLNFVTRATSIASLAALDGVDSYVWLGPDEIDERQLAFPSNRCALQAYLQITSRPP